MSKISLNNINYWLLIYALNLWNLLQGTVWQRETTTNNVNIGTSINIQDLQR